MFKNIFDFFCKSHELIGMRLRKEVEDQYVFEKDGFSTVVINCYAVNALYIFMEKSDIILKEVLKKCPRCTSDEVIQRIFYYQITEEDEPKIEAGELDVLPGVYERLEVPVPNWKCKCCGLGWHNLEDIRKGVERPG